MQVPKIPFKLIEHIDRTSRRDLHIMGLDLQVRVDCECETFKATGKTTRKLIGIWVEWMETHWYQSSIDIPNMDVVANEPYGDVCRVAKWYKNETFAKAFALTLMMGQKTTADLTEYECWEGDDPRTDLTDTTVILARRFGSYPYTTESRFNYHWDHKDEMTKLDWMQMMRPNQLLVLNYEFEE